MIITAKLLSRPLSATLLAFAIGCGEQDADPDSGDDPSPEAPAAGQGKKPPPAAASDASAIAIADSGPADAGTISPPTSPPASSVAAADAAAPDHDAQAADASAGSASDAKVGPSAPTASCRDEFYQCIQHRQVTYKDDAAAIAASANPITGIPTVNREEEIIKPCIPAAEACGLFPTGTGLECLAKFEGCRDQTSELQACVDVGQECGLLGPEADPCVAEFYTCAAVAGLSIFTIVESAGACLTEAQQCGLTPILTTLGGWFGAAP